MSLWSFKSSAMQHDARLVNTGPIQSTIDNKPGYVFGQGHFVINKPVPQQPENLVLATLT